jgi:hypothetical protein
MNSQRRAYLFLCFGLVLFCLSLASTSTQADGRAYRFPLWKDVPGESFAVLNHGVDRTGEWAAFAFNGSAKPRGRKNPCIHIARFTKGGSYANAGGCGPLAPEMGLRYPPISPLIGEVGASIFAISFARSVRQVEIELGSGAVIHRAPKTLTRHQAKKARLPRLGYVAMAVGEDACISRIEGFNGAGELILDFETHEC